MTPEERKAALEEYKKRVAERGLKLRLGPAELARPGVVEMLVAVEARQRWAIEAALEVELSKLARGILQDWIFRSRDKRQREVYLMSEATGSSADRLHRIYVDWMTRYGS